MQSRCDATGLSYYREGRGHILGMNIRLQVGKRIRDLRTKLGLTQAQLAEKIEIGDGAMSDIERGVFGPGMDSLPKIANALETSVSSLFAYVPNLHTESDERLRLLTVLNDKASDLGDEHIRLLLDQIDATLKRLKLM